jgi:hypothetical protein
MIVEIDGRKYKVTWKHDKDVSPNFPYKVMTYCDIYDNDSTVRLAGGLARCSLKDNFSRKIGRRLSLVRALHFMNTDKGIRARFWDEYFKRWAHD